MIQVQNSPDPNDENYTPINSSYIQTKLGPPSLNQTTTYNINNKLNNTKIVIDSLLQFFNSATNISNNIDFIKQELKQNKIFISDFSNHIDNISNYVINNLDISEYYNSIINLFLYILFGGCILCILLSFIGVIFTYCYGNNGKCIVFLNFGWFLCSILMILGFLLSCFLAPSTIALNEVCGWLDNYLKDINEFSDPKYTFMPSDMQKKLQICKFQNGCLIDEFNLKNNFDDIKNMIFSLNKFLNFTNFESSYYINLNQSEQIIDFELQILEKLKNGIFDDFPDSNKRQNGFYQLKFFNRWSDYSQNQENLKTQSCIFFKDEYVFNKSNCSYINQYNTSENEYQSIGQKICIGITDLNFQQMINRYNIMLIQCNIQYFQQIQNYFSSIQRFDTSRRILFQNIINDLKYLKNKNNQLNLLLKNYSDQIVIPFRKEIQPLDDLIFNSNNGLIAQFNCSLVSKNLDKVYDSLCIGFVIPIFKIVIAVVITSFGMFFATLSSFFLSIRIQKIFIRKNINKIQDIYKSTPSPQQLLRRNINRQNVNIEMAVIN